MSDETREMRRPKNDVERVYEFIAAHPGATGAEIAAGTGLNRAMVGYCLAALVEHELVEEQPARYVKVRRSWL